jgi:imidazolonepropionase-like amidohydrolase
MRAGPLAAALCATLFGGSVLVAQDVAIVGATLIDGKGGPPVRNSIVVVRDQRIAAAGPHASTRTPAGATVIDGGGRFVIPGLIETNVHLSLYGGQRDRYETLAKYYSRQDEIVLEAAQIQLRYGVTTVRDSYGVLAPPTRVRASIAQGQAVGARILAAGNIVG